LQRVNTGKSDSAYETRAAERLRALVDIPGVDLQLFGPLANRRSLVAHLPGTDPIGGDAVVARAHRCRVP
jgi:hypothetical protein